MIHIVLFYHHAIVSHKKISVHFRPNPNRKQNPVRRKKLHLQKRKRRLIPQTRNKTNQNQRKKSQKKKTVTTMKPQKRKKADPLQKNPVRRKNHPLKRGPSPLPPLLMNFHQVQKKIVTKRKTVVVILYLQRVNTNQKRQSRGVAEVVLKNGGGVIMICHQTKTVPHHQVRIQLQP